MKDIKVWCLDQVESHDLSVGNEELLARCARGDQHALKALFSRHERPVYRMLYRMLGCREDAEEALADVFVKIWRGAAGFRGTASFTTWLYRIAANAARDMLRSRRGRIEVPLEELMINEARLLERASADFDDPEESLIRAQANAVLASAMARLSDEDRLLITLYHLQDLSYEEISEITKLPTAHLKVKVFRARQRLKKYCETIEEEEKNGLRNSTGESTGIQPPATEPL